MYQKTLERLLKIVVQMKISLLELEQAALRYLWWDNLSVFEYLNCYYSCYWHRNILPIHFAVNGMGFKILEIYFTIPFIVNGIERNGLVANLHTD